MGWTPSNTTIGRGILFALGGALGTAFGILLVSYIGDISSHIHAKHAARAYETSASIEADHNCRNLTGADKAYCQEQVARSAREQERQEYELDADQRQAIWSAASGTAAAFSLLFSLVTIAAIYFTYWEQRYSNRVQLANFLDSRRRARQSLAHAQTVSHYQLRPYVFVDKISADRLSDRMFRVTVWLKNFGQTPARHLEAIVTSYVTYDLHKLKPHKTRADLIELDTAAPNACRRAMVPLRFTEKQWESPAYDQAWGVVRIKYRYTDDSGANTFDEVFDYHTTPSELTRDEPTFYLLTRSRLRRSENVAKRQGEFMLHLKRRRRANRKKTEPSKKGKEG